MTVLDLIQLLSTHDLDRDVVIEDLNGLYWKMEPSLVRLVDDDVVIGTADLNKIAR